MKYPVELKEVSDDSGDYWVASIPVLGRHSFRAFGDTAAEALEELESVRRALIEDIYEHDGVIPLPPDDADTDHNGVPGLRISRSLHAIAARRAQEEGVSLNRYLTELIASGIGRDATVRMLENRIIELTRGVKTLSQSMAGVFYQMEPTPNAGKQTDDHLAAYADRAPGWPTSRNAFWKGKAA